ncbi:solute carrier family 46 member 3-like [Actinia tenebrosa]|uniref:Solute carrier family 46 member 3-like n=1 Tax=Actinia tenebrosa TaxID=6105 RepID=A0A6P8HI40_ACTTE|nr:solute carrier family 46 member 3-like [Actinia tenebrosa]
MKISNIFRNITVEPVLFLYMFCTFMSFPLLQQLAYRKICQEKLNETSCENLTKTQRDGVQEDTSNWMVYQSVALGVPSIAASLVYGSWSDSVGRKFIMILPPIGNALMNINYLLNVHFFQVNVNYLLIGIVISGFFGGYATVLSSVFSYIADVSDKSSRTLRISILESMVFLGASGGEMVAGVLLDSSGFMAAFGLALAINVCIILYVSLWLRESYFPTDQVHANPLIKLHSHIKNVLTVLFKARDEDQRLYLLVVLFGALPIVLINFGGFNDTSLLYIINQPLSFSSSYIGYFLSEVYFIRGLGVVVGMPILTKYFKVSDYLIAVFGMMITLVVFIFYGFATRKWMMFLGAAFAFGDGWPVPCMRAMMSKSVQTDEQGTMFAAVASLEVLSTLLASLIFNSIYSKTVSWLPGFTFFLLSGILLIPIGIILTLYFKKRKGYQYKVMEDPEDSIHNLPVNT